MDTVVQFDETVAKRVSPPLLEPTVTATSTSQIAEEPSPVYEPVVNHVQPSPPRKRLPKVLDISDSFWHHLYFLRKVYLK